MRPVDSLFAPCQVLTHLPASHSSHQHPNQHQQELVKERFDPKKFLSVFKKGHPEWLDRLIQQPSNRKMVYELSAANKNSLLLNYAIQRILKLVGVLVVAWLNGALDGW